MDKRLLVAAITASLVLVLTAGILFAELAQANPVSMFKRINPIPGTVPPIITITSPQNNSATFSHILNVSFGVEKPFLSNCLTEISEVKYTLDDQFTKAFTIWSGDGFVPWIHLAIPEYNTTFTSPFLPNGNHNLTITAQGVVYSNETLGIFFIESSTTVYFATGTNTYKPNSTTTPLSSSNPNDAPSPTITILYPLNNSFFNVSLGGVRYQLRYETNNSLSWVGYSLDGANNATVIGNSTFVHEFVSSNGYHTLIVYANDTSGNWAIPQTATYLVNFYPDYTPSSSPSPTPTPTLEPSPTPTRPEETFVPLAIVAAIGLVIAVAVLSLIVYFAKGRGSK